MRTSSRSILPFADPVESVGSGSDGSEPYPHAACDTSGSRGGENAFPIRASPATASPVPTTRRSKGLTSHTLFLRRRSHAYPSYRLDAASTATKTTSHAKASQPTIRGS